MAVEPDPTYLRALVDMGSNGIRFSVSNLSPDTARILPTVFQDRAGISLYDAQYSTGTKAPIPNRVIDDVLAAFMKFKRVCADFAVAREHIRVVATEATREAINSVAFRAIIKEAVGWEVDILPKEEEGSVGAMGISSSFTDVNGLVLDLGGGSVQMSWMSTRDGEVEVKGSTSLPYGAAALMRRLTDAKDNEKMLADLEKEVKTALASAFALVTGAEARSSPFPIFLSGGGFRGWGHILMDQHPLTPYPIPIINGFSVPPSTFTNTPSVQSHITATTTSGADEKIFRISERREQQVPAIAFLISALTSTIPNISIVRFAQGGVREGLLFAALPRQVRAESPLLVATRAHAPRAHKEMLALITSAIPLQICPPKIYRLLIPFANLLFAHRASPKEAHAAAALHSTTTGILGSVHGVTHEERAMLALLLCERWGGEVAPTDEEHLSRVQTLLGPQASWWCKYVGRIGGLIGAVYPAGVVPMERFKVVAGITKKGVGLTVQWIEGRGEYEKEVRGIEKVGKKKNWIGEKGEHGWGMKVEIVEE